MRTGKRSVLSKIALVVGILIVGLYLVFPFSMGVVAVFPTRETVGAPPDGFDEIQLTTADNQTLSAWYKPSGNGTAIILVHGAGGSREQLRPYAAMLARNGFGVLAMDLRGHGASSGKTNRLGWSSNPDIGAAAAYLQGQADVRQIGGLGLSMGGEVLLGAASQYPAITMIAADGATRRSLAELTALPSERPLVRNFTARVMYASVRILSGAKPPMPLLDAMIEADGTRYLLIAAGNNASEVAFNQLFADTLGARAALWIAADTTHTGAFYRYPDEYEQRVVDFFNGE